MSRRFKLIVTGTLLFITALALGLTMSVVLNTKASPDATPATQATAPQPDPEQGLSSSFGDDLGAAPDIQSYIGSIPELDNALNMAQQMAGGRGGFGLTNGPEAQGVISSVDTGGNKITLNNNRVVNIDGNTVLGDSNGSIKIGDLKAGDRVVAVGTVGSDNSITAKYLIRLPALPKAITGSLVSVDSNANTLTFKSSDASWTATLDSNARIYKDGNSAKLGDLTTGQNVTVIGTVDQNAKTVKASNVVQGRAPRPNVGDAVTGKVQSVNAGGNSFVITVTDPATKNTSNVTVNVTGSTRYAGNNIKGLGDLKAGDQVFVRGTKQADGSYTATDVADGAGFMRGKGPGAGGPGMGGPGGRGFFGGGMGGGMRGNNGNNGNNNNNQGQNSNI